MKHTLLYLPLLVAGASLISVPNAKAAVEAADIALLNKKIDALVKELETLKAQHRKEKTPKQHKSQPLAHASKKKAELPKPLVVSGNDKVKLKLSGQVNRAMAYHDNGLNTQFRHVDNNASSSRMTLAGEGKLTDSFKAGGVIEAEIVSDSSKSVSMGTLAASSSTVSFTERKIEGYFDTRWGKLWLGQGETASHRVSDLDLSETNAAQEGAEMQSLAGGIPFYNLTRNSLDATTLTNTGAQGATLTTVANTWIEMGSRRVDRIRYDTPSMNGFVLSVAHGTRDMSDIGLRYAGEIQKVKLVAALGYAHIPFTVSYTPAIGNVQQRSNPTNVTRDEYGGSLAVLFPNGISLSAAYAGTKFDQAGRKKGHLWHTKLGYQTKFLPWGKTCVAISYGIAKAMRQASRSGAANTPQTAANMNTDTTNINVQNSERMDILGLYMVQKLDKISTELYVGYQYHKLKKKAFVVNTAGADQNIKPLHALLVGTRIKF